MTLLLILQVNSFDEQEVSGTNLETTQKFGCRDELQSKKLDLTLPPMTLLRKIEF